MPATPFNECSVVGLLKITGAAKTMTRWVPHGWITVWEMRATWMDRAFSIGIRYALGVVFSASLAFNSPAQTSVVRIPSAPSSATLTVPIETGWAIEVRCNHDDRELTCVIANLKHGEEERYPELLIDPQNRRSSNWQRGQWWLHSSYNLCEGNGEFNVYVHNGIHRCTKDKPGWRANHFPLNADDAMTIHVLLSKIGLLPGHRFGFAVDVTDTQSDWHFWPPGASLKSPATWGAAELTQRPGS
jgi:hypothetical protein